MVCNETRSHERCPFYHYRKNSGLSITRYYSINVKILTFVLNIVQGKMRTIKAFPPFESVFSCSVTMRLQENEIKRKKWLNRQGSPVVRDSTFNFVLMNKFVYRMLLFVHPQYIEAQLLLTLTGAIGHEI